MRHLKEITHITEEAARNVQRLGRVRLSGPELVWRGFVVLVDGEDERVVPVDNDHPARS